MKTTLIEHDIIRIAKKVIPNIPVSIDTLIEIQKSRYPSKQCEASNFPGMLLEIHLKLILQALEEAMPDRVEIERLTKQRKGWEYRLIRRNQFDLSLVAVTIPSNEQVKEYDAVTLVKKENESNQIEAIIVWEAKTGISSTNLFKGGVSAETIDLQFKPLRRVYKNKPFGLVYIVLKDIPIKAPLIITRLKQFNVTIIPVPMEHEEFREQALSAGYANGLILS